MAGYRTASGETNQVEINVSMYAEAAEAGMTLPQYINSQHNNTNATSDGTAWQQIAASEGMFVTRNGEYGIAPPTMHAIINGTTGISASTTVRDAVPTSRILFPAVVLQAVEDKLYTSLSMTADALESVIAVDDAINQDRYEQPVISLAPAEAGRSMATSQMARPPAMLTITTSERGFKIPSFALGLQVSDQALKYATLDFVAMAIARQAAVERNERAQGYMLALLNGDVDNGEASLASLGYMDAASVFDSAATGGAITQRAWIKYLMKNGTKRRLTHLITDVDTAMKLDTRTGKPAVTNDDSKTARFDTQFRVMNPTWATNPELLLTDIAAWPANTILGFDKSWAIRRVRNLSAQYSAIEAYAMRRSTELRFDFGEHMSRMYDEAFAGLVLS